VPLLPPTEEPALPSHLTQQPSPPAPTALEPALPVNEAVASVPSLDFLQFESEVEDVTDSEFASHSSSHHHRQRLMTTIIPMYAGSPSSSTTPSLSSASDTDDMDTEDEPPSVVDGSSAPSSPGERECFSALSQVHVVAANAKTMANTNNPYFPPLSSHTQDRRMHTPQTPRQDSKIADMCEIARPGQTPPLSSLYPEHHARAMGMLRDKVRLEAIPSPSLAPPSPFSLYPSSPGAAAGIVGMGKRGCFARSVSKLSLSEVDEEGRGLGLLKPSFTRRKDGHEGESIEEVEVVREVELMES